MIAENGKGLREGEKLEEKLFYHHEKVCPTSCDKIKRTDESVKDRSRLFRQVEELRASVSVDGAAPIRVTIEEIVPDYSSQADQSILRIGSTGATVTCPSPRPMPQRIRELDGIRAVAILLVIGCHYEVLARQLWSIPQFGWLGVDMFFVLSGYLITSVLLGLKGKEHAFRTFYLRRFLRIFPPYFLSLLAIYVVCLSVRDYTLFSAKLVAKNLLFLQSFGELPKLVQAFHHGFVPLMGNAHNMPPNLRGIYGDISNSTTVLWSLSIEEYFYVLWAPLVLCFSRKTVIWTGIAICFVEFWLRWTAFTGSVSYFSIYHRFDALIYGSLAAILLSSPVARKVWLKTAFATLAAASFAGVLAICFAIAPFVGHEVRSNPLFIVVGIPLISLAATSVVSLLVLYSGNRYLAPFRIKSLRFIGTVSYMLYLTHALVYLVMLRFFAPAWGMTVASTAIATGICALSWRYIELPILGLKDRMASAAVAGAVGG